MINNKSERFIIYSAIKRVKNGEDKAIVFNELKDKVDQSELAKQLATVPDIDLAKKYTSLNIALTTVLVTLTLLGIIFILSNFELYEKHNTVFNLSSLLLTFMQIYLVSQKNALIYRILAIIYFIFIIASLSILDLNYIYLIFLVTVVILSSIIGIKMFPYYGIFEPKRSKDGNYIYTNKG